MAGDEQGRRHAAGFLYDRRAGDGWVAIRDVDLATDYDESGYHTRVHVTVHTDERSYDVEGEVWSSIPLRNRRNGKTTRIVEGMTRWRHDGIEGSGLAEYLDQIVDGQAVGIAAEG